jgi:ankyrin repeat protein
MARCARLNPSPHKFWFVLLVLVAALAAAGVRASSETVLDAAARGDLDMVRQLLKSGADVNSARADGVSALHLAASAGKLEIARVLMTAGANVGASTMLLGTRPLHMAAENGHADVVDLLLARGADPNAANRLGTTALMLAARSGDAKTVTVLLDGGADPDARETAKGETALMFAAAYGRAAAAAVLLERGADWRPTTKVFDWTKLPKDDPRLASGDAHPVKAASAPGAKRPMPEDEEESGGPRPPSYVEIVGTQGGLGAMMFAARQGHEAVIRALVEHHADVNQTSPGDGTTALMIAIVNGRFDLAMYLLERGADPNLAQRNGAAPLYAVLDTRWAPKSEYPNPLYYTEQRTDYIQLLRTLLDRGADANARLRSKVWYTNQNNDQSGLDETGATPFWRAAYAADVDAMRLLIEHGADPTIPTTFVGRSRYDDMQTDPSDREDRSDLPPAQLGGPSITPLLAAAGEGYGWSFTANHHRYAPTGFLPAVKYLVDELHADVNARDADGNTPLHNAAARGDNEMILYLISKGADIKAINRKGQTVADMANGPVQRVQPFGETLALLAKMGVKPHKTCVSC